MSDKAIKELQASWKPVQKKGGYFALAMNGFPGDPAAFPLLQVDRKREVSRKSLGKLGKDADLSKVISGRITAGEEGLAFNISLESPVKSPELLKKAIKRLSEHDGARKAGMGAAARAHFRLEQAELDGGAALDSEDQAKEKGGEASLTAKLTGSPYAKLLEKLKAWDKRFGNRLDSGTVEEAAAALAEIDARAEEWIAKHEGEAGKGERRREVQAIRGQVRRAQARLASFRQKIAADDAADADIDALLSGEAPDLGDDRLGRLLALQESLVGRLEATEDEDERALLLERIQSLDDVVGQEPAPEDPRAARTLLLARQKALASQPIGPDKLEAAQALFARMLTGLDDPELSTNAVPHGVDAQMAGLLGLMDALEAGGCKAEAIECRKKIAALTIEVNAREWQEEAEGIDAETFRGKIGRDTGPGSKLRAAFARHVGKEYADKLFSETRARVGQDLALDSERFADPEAQEAYERVVEVNRRIGEQRGPLLAALTERLRAQLAPLGVELPELDSFVSQRVPRPDLTGDDAPEIPTPRQLLEDYLAANPAVKQAYDQRPGANDGALREQQEREDAAAQQRAQDAQAELLRLRDEELAEARAELEEKGGGSLDAIREIFASTMNRLLSKVRNIPRPVRQLCLDAFDAVGEIPQADDKACRAIVTDILVLRWLSAELFAARFPDPDTGEERAAPAATIVAQLLQSVANQVVPTGPRFMPFVADVKAFIPRYQEFITKLLDYMREKQGVSISDTNKIVTEDRLTGEEISGSVHDVDHPEARPGEEPYESLVNEAKYAGDPKGYWRNVVRKHLRKDAMEIAKSRGDGRLLFKSGGMDSFFGPTREFFRERFKDPDAMEPSGFKGRSKVLADTVSHAADLLLEEARDLLAGRKGESEIYDLTDDDEQLTAEEHWESFAVPRMAAVVNKLLSEEAFRQLMPGNLTPLFAQLQPQHAAVFDPAIHRELEAKDRKLDPAMLGLFEQANAVIRAEMERAAAGEPSEHFTRLG